MSSSYPSSLCKLKDRKQCFWKFVDGSKSSEFVTVSDGLFYFYKGVQADLANIAELESALARLYQSSLAENTVAFMQKTVIAVVVPKEKTPTSNIPMPATYDKPN